MKKAKNISEISAELSKKRLQTMKIASEKMMNNVENMHVFFSPGNTKLGNIPSVSTIPVLCCPNCKACKGLCYDLRNDCMYPEVCNTRARNYAIYKSDQKRYFDEIEEFCRKQTEFRWHIGGDIIDKDYLLGIIRVATSNRNCQNLIFTKNFKVVNDYVSEGGIIPENLKIIFSAWIGQETPNPYNFPTSNPIFADGSTTAPDGAIFCSGNCSECVKLKKGCFNLKPGEAVIFPVH